MGHSSTSDESGQSERPVSATHVANDAGCVVHMRRPMMVLISNGNVMKLIHVLTLFLVIIGGLHFALTGFGINLLGTVFGGANLTVLYIVMGLSTIYHVMPLLRTHLNTLS